MIDKQPGKCEVKFVDHILTYDCGIIFCVSIKKSTFNGKGLSNKNSTAALLEVLLAENLSVTASRVNPLHFLYQAA
jgi:hypothetical protein